MANIGTIAVRFYARAGNRYNDGLKEAYILRLLLGDRFSYNVPVYIDYGFGYLDIQYGSRWASAQRVKDVIDRYGHLFDRTWIRYSDDGRNEDYLFPWDKDDWEKETPFDTRKCRYGIDRIKIYDREPPDESWQADGDGWTLAIEGGYYTLNSRSTLGDRMCPISTLTTPTDGFANLYDLVPEAFAKIHETLPKDRCRIEYLWKDRIVHVSFPCKSDGFSEDPWVEYSLDYGDNCVDPEYLDYHERMRKSISRSL